jgi:CRP-like cAMP-binding protein
MPISNEDMLRLRALPLFSGLPEEMIQRLLAKAIVRTHPRGTVLFVQDDPATNFYVIFSGWVKLYRLNEKGDEAIVEIFGLGESFAEGAMHGLGKYPVCAETVSECRLLEIPTDAFRNMIRSAPDLAINMLGSMAVRLKSFVRRTEQSHTKSAAQRVANFLLKFCPDDQTATTIHLPYDKLLIAGRLGMKPETFSRAMAKLREVGAKTEGHDVHIADVEALRQFEEGAERW